MRGGWSGFGMEKVGIHPNDFDLDPNKIPTGGVVQNCRKMHYKQVANRWKEKWQTGGRDKCLSAAEPSEVLKVWLIRIPSFCVDDSNSVPNLPLPMKNIGKKAPGSFIHKLYGLRSPDPLHERVGEP